MEENKKKIRISNFFMALSGRAGSAGQHGGLGAGTGTVGHGLGCSNAVLFRPVPVLAQRAWPIWPPAVVCLLGTLIEALQS